MSKIKAVIDFYQDTAYQLAIMHGKLQEMQEHAEFWGDQMHDNADPASDLMDAMTALGKALASCVVYANEYKEEEDGASEGKDSDTCGQVGAVVK